MTDYFAVLHQPRRPWLDAESLKDTFHTLSAAAHPDRHHGRDPQTREAADARYAELNAAYQCLRNHKSRLAHLLLLETGSKPGDLRAMPEDLVEMFGAVGAILRESNPLLAEKVLASSAIQKAGVLSRSLPLLERISQLQTSIQSQREAAEAELRTLDANWNENALRPPRRSDTLTTMERLYHSFGFHERWASQLQERSFQFTV